MFFFRKFQLRPKEGSQKEIINEFFEDPGIIKQVEILDGKIIVRRICPYGHPSPITFNADEFSIVGRECPPPESG